MYRGRGPRRDSRSTPYHHPRRTQRPPRPPHQAFDLWLAEEFFPPACPTPDDGALAKALIARHNQLQPSPAQLTQMTDLLTKVTTALDNLIVMQTGQEEHALEEVRVVGHHKQGTALVDDNCAEVVILYKTWPTAQSIESLCCVVRENLQELEVPSDSFSITCEKTSFTVQMGTVQARCYAATLPDSWLEPTVTGQVEMKDIEAALALIRRTRWFEETITQTSTRMLIRLMTDLGTRISGFKHLSTWIIVLLAQQASIVQGRRDALPIAPAFRRAMHLLAAGFFLPGSEGIPDPCEPSGYRVHHALGFEKQEALCCAAQTILRLLSHGAHKEILGVNKDCNVDFDTIMNCGGVVISPSVAVYQREDEASEEQTMESNNSEAPATQDTGPGTV